MKDTGYTACKMDMVLELTPKVADCPDKIHNLNHFQCHDVAGENDCTEKAD
jgi:hypothetical protein